MAIELDKRTRITISIPEELLIKVDKATLKEYTNRSQWIVNAMLEKLRKSDSLRDNELDDRNRKEEKYDLFKDLK
jgi:metal-responsive CopG/Arc/MetJ family transcriptional regulator